MLIYLLFGIIILQNFLSTVLNKQFQLGFQSDFVHFISYNFVNAAFASVYFFIGNRFMPDMNFITFIYSVIFAVIVILSLIVNILSLSRVSVSLVGITTTAGSVILPALFGIFFLSEAASLRLFLSLILMLAAVFIPYWKFCDFDKSSIPVCLAQFLIPAFSVILQKLYTATSGTCDTNSFFLMTNLLIVLFSAIVLLFFVFKKPQRAKNILMPFSPKQLGNIAARTLLSNAGSVVSIILLANMDISLYTVLSSAAGIISGAIISKFIFREYMPAENVIAVILSVCAILITLK